MKKFFSAIIILCAVFLFATWQYRLICVIVLVLLWRRKIKEMAFMQKWEHSFAYLLCMLFFLLYLTLPNYWQRGRTQLIYLTEQGKARKVPWSVYFVNVIFPEKEVMNFGVKLVGFFPYDYVKQFIPLNNYYIEEAHKDFWKGKTWKFYNAYNHISNCGTYAITQTLNSCIGSNYNAIYVTRPKNYDAEKQYPVVFFAHGYLGSWQLYQGLLCSLDDCIIVSFGTRDLSGVFTQKDINACFSEYIPYLKTQGYKIDEKKLHIMGLSNGGSATNVALMRFSSKFKTITFISTSCNCYKSSYAKVLLVGGGNDPATKGFLATQRKLRANGVKNAMYFNKEANHYMFVYEKDAIMEFLKKECEL